VTLLLRRRSDGGGLLSLEELSAVRPHQHLTHEEFHEAHGADPEDIDRVAEFARSHELAVVETSIPRRTVTLSGTVAAIESAFGVELISYEDGQGIHSSHIDDVTVPTELCDVVEWVFGLHSTPVVRPSFHLRPVDPASEDAGQTSYYAPQVADAYDFPGALNGKGECIGIITMSGGYRQSDLDAYFARLGLPVPEIVDVGNNMPESDVMSNMEVTLDISVAGAVAPGARIVVYFANGLTGRDLYDITARAIHDVDNAPSVLSFSWGNPETEGWGTGDIDKLNELFREAAHLGVTICTSSGDSGSCVPNGSTSFSAPSITDFPASSPYVLACGGTTLRLDQGRIKSEVVWNCLAQLLDVVIGANPGQMESMLGHGGASGGGVSSLHSLPPYQQQADVPVSVRTQWNNGVLGSPQFFHGRGVPDVAGNADLDSGYRMMFDGIWVVGGGTSAVAPLWAGLLARLNQGLKRRVGFVNPLFYHFQLVEQSNVLHPITRGNNGGFDAHPDKLWNACTGLGTPRGTALLRRLTEFYTEQS
jgi:kumamolisin